MTYSAYMISFLLPAMILSAVFVGQGVFPFGDKLFLPGDLYHQYMPFMNEFYERIHLGKCFDYATNMGIGSNFYALYGYYLASPFHWLSLLVPSKYLTTYIDIMIIFKTGLCGLTSHHYLSENSVVNGKKVFLPCLFTMFYALSGFMAAYNYNIMWLDCVILLPLIVLGAERLVKEGKPFLYVITLGCAILTNFYLSIMICMFLVIYFFVLIFTEKCSVKAFVQFAIYSLLSGGIAGVILVPEGIALMATDFGDIAFPNNIESYFDLFDVIGRHCVGTNTYRGLDHWPNIYCGCAVFFLLVIFVLQDRIPARKRFLYMGLLLFFLFSFSTNVLSFIWHGMNYPDSLPARQSFIYIFLVISMCYQAVSLLAKENKKLVLYGVLTGISYLILWQKLGTKDTFGEVTLVLNISLVAIYGALLYMSLSGTMRKKIFVGIIALCILTAECTVNFSQTGMSTVGRTGYLENQDTIKSFYEKAAKEENTFFRMEKFKRKTKNDSALGQYPSATLFSSTLNSDVVRLYKRLGMRYSKVFYCYDGATAFTSALLNVDYMIGDTYEYENSLYSPVEQNEEVYLYKANHTLPFGYVAPYEYDITQMTSDNGILLQNEMVEALGIDKPIFHKELAEYDGLKVVFKAQRPGIYYGRLSTSGIKKMQAVGGSPETVDYQDLKAGSILYLGYLAEGESITLENRTPDSDKKPAVSIYRLDEDALTLAINMLKKNSMQNVVYRDGYVAGDICMEKKGRVILSLPAESGWKVYINNEPFECHSFGDALIALDLLPGEYTVELKYEASGKTAGVLLSALSIVVVAFLYFGHRRRRNTKP